MVFKSKIITSNTYNITQISLLQMKHLINEQQNKPLLSALQSFASTALLQMV